MVKELLPRILYPFKCLHKYIFACNAQNLITINKRMKATNYLFKKNYEILHRKISRTMNYGPRILFLIQPLFLKILKNSPSSLLFRSLCKRVKN